jgi:glycosyltransferase involved in cell wall biosynthesis
MENAWGLERSLSAAFVLSPEAPYPAESGGALRTASILEFLAQHYTLDVITFRQPGAPDPRDAFPKGLIRQVYVIDLPSHSRSPFPRAARNLRRAVQGRPPLLDRFSGFNLPVQSTGYDLGLIEHFWCAPYQSQLRGHCRKLILDLHNIESIWHATLAASEPKPISFIHRRFQAAYTRLERLLLPGFDLLLVTSQTDADRVSNLAPTRIYPNCIPFVPCPVRRERDAILFTGNLEYQPNISAVRYFRDRVWPAIKADAPQVIWEIAGKNGSAIDSLIQTDKRIRNAGIFDNAARRIAEAKVAVVPLQAGSGTRIKILEAWAAATPVVSSPIGAEGLECIPGRDILIAKNPEEFSSMVLYLLSDVEKRIQIGRNGRLLYEHSYTWDRGWKLLNEILFDGPQTACLDGP